MRSGTRDLGSEFVALCDLVCADVVESADSQRRWVKKALLEDLTRRYRKHGLDLRWDPTVVDWLVTQRETHQDRHAWERLVDKHIASLLVRHLPESPDTEPKGVLVVYRDGAFSMVDDDTDGSAGAE